MTQRNRTWKSFDDGEASFRRLAAQTQRRLLARDALDALATNMTTTGVLALIFALACAVFDEPLVSPVVFLTATVAIALVGALVSLVATRRDPYEAEKTIDEKRNLQDRCLTAASILHEAKSREIAPVERLQLLDCFDRVADENAATIVSIKPKRAKQRFALVAFLTIGAFVLAWKPFADQAIARTPNETVVDVATEITDAILPEIEKIAAANPENQKLQEAKAKLNDLATELGRYDDDPKKGAAIVAQMEREIEKAIDASGLDATDAAFKDLSSAFAGIESTSAVARAFADGDYEAAADELERLDFEKMSARDRHALADKLRAAAEIVRSRKEEQTAKLVEQLADELQEGKCASCKNTACKLAGKARAQKKNKETAKQLDCQLARLGLCKSNCVGACATCEQNCASKGAEGAKTSGEGNRGTQNSGSDALKSGLASDPLAAKNEKLDSQRVLEKVAGRADENGESALESVETTEGAAALDPARALDLDEREFQTQLEAALDQDDVPLERRRVVRDYFESLRNAAN